MGKGKTYNGHLYELGPFQRETKFFICFLMVRFQCSYYGIMLRVLRLVAALHIAAYQFHLSRVKQATR